MKKNSLLWALSLLGACCLCSCGDDSSGAKEDPSVAGVCGDGVLDAGEGCDDGNTVDGDGCSSKCRVEATASTSGSLW